MWFYPPRRHSLTLKSGVKSNVYVFGREDLTDHPELELLAGAKIAQTILKSPHFDDERQICLIGIPTAGTALAQAAAMVSVLPDVEQRIRTEVSMPLCHRIMREALKQHGTHHGWVNGKPDFERHQYCLVDNVSTNGASKLEAAEKVKADGYAGIEMPSLIFVERQQGAIENLKKAGMTKIEVVFNLLDVTFVFRELGLWPGNAVASVEREIREHQLLLQ